MKSTISALDKIDFRILEHLSKDGRLSDAALSDAVNLSSTATSRRRRMLEESGVIEGYEVRLNLDMLGLDGVVIVSIELNTQVEQALLEFENAIKKCSFVSYCGFISGDTDFIAVLHVHSLADYDSMYRKELSILPHVARIRSGFVIREVMQSRTPAIALLGSKY